MAISRCIEITEVKEMSEDLVPAFARLVPQLSSSGILPDENDLKEIIASSSVILFIARDKTRDGAIVGVTLLVIFRILTGMRAWIEDVVVDSDYRSMGIGEELNKAALKRAELEKATTVELTSRPSREGAIRLYERIGFKKRETNVFRYELG